MLKVSARYLRVCASFVSSACLDGSEEFPNSWRTRDATESTTSSFTFLSMMTCVHSRQNNHKLQKERIEAEKRAEEERAQKILHDAAAKIQALFRGVQCRKEQAKSAGKKGKKGKVCIIHAVLLQRWLYQHAASGFATASLTSVCTVRVQHEC